MGLKWGGGCHPHRPAILQSWYSGTWVYFRARWSKGYPFDQKGSTGPAGDSRPVVNKRFNCSPRAMPLPFALDLQLS